MPKQSLTQPPRISVFPDPTMVLHSCTPIQIPQVILYTDHQVLAHVFFVASFPAPLLEGSSYGRL